ncbi:molybdopterin cofactor-binding domain-containing protein [Fulvimarina sp. 2208YS6-2-32]|uniref:Molybdopterin cofactor-binding domain-containing protein n=1 Tax=Fulvimarina uroteuthidis TaxID=3098149 RepID=A0ABU5I602_9HYPH|nr:molybdopterin cofactor-binding domain-containing protein [Fulvimarina sp. 2208YS6-2-32]MDY8110818.1 molybdopterin cofactor-binding domain-containing protein [Fulvimarina sp. 2208YS6-2-32]
MTINPPTDRWIGRSVPRVEDAALLTGRGRFIDDLATSTTTLDAAIVRSPHGHATIRSIDLAEALQSEGVVAVITGEDIKRLTRSMTVGVKANVECWPIATDRVRYVGEPVVIVVATNRYLAEDAAERVVVDYETLAAVVEPLAALSSDAPVLHPSLGSNLINERSFSYGEPEEAFARAPHRIGIETVYPRNSCTPIETYGVIASYDPGEDAYEIEANFQGPFSIHAVVARALNVPGNRMRLKTPPSSGGSYGIKQGVFPYMILMGVAARIAGRPVKWIEDRLEHLSASVSATNRVTKLEAAVEADGRITALAWDQLEDCGAHLRAPEPATLYRMHGNMTGAYAIENVSIRNRIVLTNKTPTGLNRGFGGPQIYFPLERLMQKIAWELCLDPVAVIRRNLVPADAFPYRTAMGSLLDSGDYETVLDRAITEGGLAELIERRKSARSEGRIYGIGFAAVIEPSVSNMGYITSVLTPEERERAGPKNGAQATATIAIDPLGSVSVKVASVPQGQGHRTVLAQVVADALGLEPGAVSVVADVDTGRDAWSIASGNYSSRFAPAVAGAAKLAADRLQAKLAKVAAGKLNTAPEDIAFAGGRASSIKNPDNSVSFPRVAAAAHWAPGTLPDTVDQTIRETVFWTPDELSAPNAADEVNSSLCHGFIFDFCGIEIDPKTGEARIDRYVTMHDCGTILHPAMVDGQVRGGFAHALGAALLEEYAYGADGSFRSGTLADYLIPTVMEVPEPLILHHETPSPFTPLGAKGVGEGNCMSTPACIANAVADAIGAENLTLPLTPSRIRELIADDEPQAKNPPRGNDSSKRAGPRKLTGEGSATVAAHREKVWAMLLDPNTLDAIIPGSHGVRKASDTHFLADVTLGVGPVKGRYKADIELFDLDPPNAVTLRGKTTGALGFGEGEGRITLSDAGSGKTLISYTYEAGIGGKVASVGGRLLDGAARVVIGQFFKALANHAGGTSVPGNGLLARLRAMIGGGA